MAPPQMGPCIDPERATVPSVAPPCTCRARRASPLSATVYPRLYSVDRTQGPNRNGPFQAGGADHEVRIRRGGPSPKPPARPSPAQNHINSMALRPKARSGGLIGLWYDPVGECLRGVLPLSAGAILPGRH